MLSHHHNFFFETRGKRFASFHLIKKKRVARLISGKSGKNQYNNTHVGPETAPLPGRHDWKQLQLQQHTHGDHEATHRTGRRLHPIGQEQGEEQRSNRGEDGTPACTEQDRHALAIRDGLHGSGMLLLFLGGTLGLEGGRFLLLLCDTAATARRGKQKTFALLQ